MTTRNQPTLRPTRKWLAARVTAAAGWAVLVITTGFDQAAQIALVGLLAEAAVSYLTPNAAKPTDAELTVLYDELAKLRVVYAQGAFRHSVDAGPEYLTKAARSDAGKRSARGALQAAKFSAGVPGDAPDETVPSIAKIPDAAKVRRER